MAKSPVPACQHPQFPLHRHKTGQWAAKIAGDRRYFGAVSMDPTGERAWQRYKLEKPFWESGQDPRAMARPNSQTLAPTPLWEIADRWLVYRWSLVEAADPDLRIERRTYDESKYAVERLLEIMPRESDPMRWTPRDFEKLRAALGTNDAKDGPVPLSPATKATRINNVRMMFNWAADVAKLIPSLPNWGSSFQTVGAPTKEEYRYDYQRKHGQRVFDLPTARLLLKTVDNTALERAGLNSSNTSGYRGVSERPDGRFEAYIVHRKGKLRTKEHLGVFGSAEEAAAAYRRAAEVCGIQIERRMRLGSAMFRAAMYIAANTGAYSKDIAALRDEDVELSGYYLERKRSKTGILWQAMLWPETVEAIQDYLKVRPAPAKPEWAGLLMLSATGQPVNIDIPHYDKNGKYQHTNRKDILKAAMRKLLNDIGLKDHGVNFGAWRHTFRSLASSAMGVTSQDLRKFDAINRTMAHRIPGSANRYVHLSHEQLKPVTDIVREQLWPEKVKAEKEAEIRAQERREAEARSKKNLRLVS